MIDHNTMMKLTEHMPMKQIDVLGAPYLQRYYAGQTAGGASIWLHRFIAGDGDRHLHNHPWQGRSWVLCGRYIEDYRDQYSNGVRVREACGIEAEDLANYLISGSGWIITRTKIDHVLISPFTWHRITETLPDTWTLVVVEPGRLPMWFFRNDDGDLEPMVASEEDWWKNRSRRADTAGGAQ